MFATPTASSASILSQLRDVSVRQAGLKLSMFVAAGAGRAEIETAVADCWDTRPREMSPMLLQAVLRHIRSSAIELMSFHRQDAPGIACFSRLDGSVHEDIWLYLPVDVPSAVRLGPRFHLSPLLVDHRTSEQRAIAAPERVSLLV